MTTQPTVKVQGDIAVIGIACTYPGARNASQFWHNIVHKVSSIAEVDDARWEPSKFYDPDPKAAEKIYCKVGGYLPPTMTFNPLKFGIPPNNIRGTEPDHFMMLRTIFEALDDSGYIEKHFDGDKTSVIMGRGNYLGPGMTWLMHRTVVSEMVMSIIRDVRPDLTDEQFAFVKDAIRAKLPKLTAENSGGMIPNVCTGRVANRFDFMGRNFTLDAACASSLIATDLAVQNLLTGRDNMAIAGGSHLFAHIPFLSVFNSMKAMSFSSTIRPFDEKADGTMPSEGVGVMVLKRLADAERDGDRIYAVIKGAGVASDGRAKGITAPRVEGEILAVERAYEMAGIEPTSIELIEGHGTGTLVGDEVEIKALQTVFGANDTGRPTVALGSVKSNIGHAMPAAGAAGMIKTILSLYHKVLPPTLNVNKPHKLLQSADNRFYVNSELRPWIHRNDGTPRRAAVNAFGFGGINAHVIFEEYRRADEDKQVSLLREWDSEVVVVEGANKQEIVAKLDQLQAYLQKNVDGVTLRDVAYTLNTSLEGAAECIAFVVTSLAELSEKLERAKVRLSDPNVKQVRERHGLYYFTDPEVKNGKIAVMFPGEGSQYLNMLSDLCVNFPVVRKCFDQGDSAVKGNRLPTSAVVFPPPAFSEEEEQKLEAELFSIERATEAVLTADGAAYALLEHLGVQPDMMTGHSAGEWIAMATSGMIDIDEFISSMDRLADMYRNLSDNTEIPKMAMLAIGAGREKVEELVGQIGREIYIANDNCPHQVVAVVDPTDADMVVEHILKSGVFVEKLPYDRGYHTPAFTYICEPLYQFFSSMKMTQPKLALYSCTTTELYPESREGVLDVVANTFAKPLLWRQTIESMYADGARIFIEAGPRGNLTAFVDDLLRGKPHLCVPLDQYRRPGISSLNHALGLMAAAGVKVNFAPLYERRAARKLAFDAAKDAIVPEEKQPGAMQVSICYDILVPPPPGSIPPPPGYVPGTTASPAVSAPAVSTAAAAPPAAAPVSTPAPTAPAVASSAPVPAPAAKGPMPVTPVVEKPMAILDIQAMPAPPVIPAAPAAPVGMPPAPAEMPPTMMPTMAPAAMAPGLAYQYGEPAWDSVDAELVPAQEMAYAGATADVYYAPHAASAVAEHFQVMEQFLQTQEELMAQFLANPATAEYTAAALAAPPSMEPGWSLPVAPGMSISYPAAPAYPAEPSYAPAVDPYAASYAAPAPVSYVSAPPSPVAPVAPAPAPLAPAELVTPPVETAAVMPVAPATPAPEVALPVAPAPAAAPKGPSLEELQQSLLQIVSDRTGYPADMLGMDLDLEADLGIDSIKRVEIFGALRQITGSAGVEIEAEELAKLKTLRQIMQFLETQLSVAEPAAFIAKTAPDALGSAVPVSRGSHDRMSFIRNRQVVSETPGKLLTLKVTLDLEEHLYLEDHCLYFKATDVENQCNRVFAMPMTGSIELMCEAATLMNPGKVVTGLKAVQALRPMYVEQGVPPLDIIVVLRKLDDRHTRVSTHYYREGDKPGDLMTEATIVLDAAYPVAPAPEPVDLVNRRTAICTGPDIYTTHRMFHGPNFQGIIGVDGVGENGLIARLQLLPKDKLMKSDPEPFFHLDPYLFDAAGQLVGYWPVEYLSEGFVLLPLRLADVTIYGDNPPPGSVVTVHLKVKDIIPRQLRADFDVLGPDGKLWIRVKGWEDYRFHWEQHFYDFWRFSKTNPNGRKLTIPTLEEKGLEVRVLDPMQEVQKRGLSEIVYTRMILSKREHPEYVSTFNDEVKRTDWVFRRGIAKDAARMWLKKNCALDVWPADVEIFEESRDRMSAGGHWQPQAPVPVKISAAYLDMVSVAVAGPTPTAIQLEKIGAEVLPPEEFFQPEEREWIQRLGGPAEWTARAVAAKKAAARQLHPGNDDPALCASLLLTAIDAASGTFKVADSNGQGGELTVCTIRDGALAIAIAC